MKQIKLDGVPDENNILEYENLKKISDAFKDIEKVNTNSHLLGGLDEFDSNNFKKWYQSYKALYTYPEVDRKLYKETEKKFTSIDKSKGNFDIMNLIEISAGRLLEKSFHDEGYNVRVRKTTKFDDYNGGVDYIVEFLEVDESGKKFVGEIAGIDLTIANEISPKKLLRQETMPIDYLEFIKNREGKKFETIPRLVLKMDKNLIYSFTNNYFTEILEKGDTLDDEDINYNFDLALQDLERRVKVTQKKEIFDESVLKLINDSRQKAQKLII